MRHLRGSLLTSGIDARSQARCAGPTSQRQRATSPERSRGWPPWTQSENRSPTPTRTNGQRGPGPLADQPDERTRPIDPARAEQTEMPQLRHDDLTTRLLACAEVLPSLHRQEEHRDRAAPHTTTTPLTALNTGNVHVPLPPARTAIPAWLPGPHRPFLGAVHHVVRRQPGSALQRAPDDPLCPLYRCIRADRLKAQPQTLEVVEHQRPHRVQRAA